MHEQGKTIQVISFLSAIMNKHGDKRDLDRRRTYVSDLQDGEDWQIKRILPPANAKWPTCLIIAPSTVVHNWEREFEKVCACRLPAQMHPNLFAVGVLRSWDVYGNTERKRRCPK